ncbi:antibiotic biosynthesis monooxygenase [Nocardia sp. 2YAB30]
MYARSSTIAAQPSSIDNGIANLRDEVMPNLSEIEGWVGLSLMADRASGRCIATTAWESEGAMHASRGRAQALRDGLAHMLNGPVERVEEWEIAVMHRDHPAGDGACTRCAWLQTAPDNIDQVIDTFKVGVLPETEMIDGFRSASLFVDRATGRVVGATVWASREALDNSREKADQIRAAATRRMGADVLEVAEFDLAFAHLRVPEMA